jgi:AraC-like DNA-binding protein
LELDGQPFLIRPGYASIIPPGVDTVYRYRRLSEHYYCHFQVPSEGQTTAIRAVQDVSDRFVQLNERMSAVALSVSAPEARIRSAVWDILWDLAKSEGSDGSPVEIARHPTVARAKLIIERSLAGPISVADLANEVGVSYGYLSRLFIADTGTNVIGYIRGRRSEKAAHLLRFSTLSVKSIALSVGMPDLRQFNRLIHQSMGCSPREARLSPP